MVSESATYKKMLTVMSGNSSMLAPKRADEACSWTLPKSGTIYKTAFKTTESDPSTADTAVLIDP